MGDSLRVAIDDGAVNKDNLFSMWEPTGQRQSNTESSAHHFRDNIVWQWGAGGTVYFLSTLNDQEVNRQIIQLPGFPSNDVRISFF